MSEQLSEIDFRLLTHHVVVRIPGGPPEPIATRFVTPADQDAPVRGTWEYRMEEGGDGRWTVREGGDAFAFVDDVAEAAERLEHRVVARALDYFARWGWLVVSGSLAEADDRRTLTIGDGDGSLTLLRDGDTVPLPLPMPCSGPLPRRGALTDLEVIGAPAGPLATPAALSALLAAARTDLPGGARVAVRQVTAALRDVRAYGLPAR